MRRRLVVGIVVLSVLAAGGVRGAGNGAAGSEPGLERGTAPGGMVRIPAGSYAPLYVENAQARQVAAFYLDADPVTNGEFLEFVRAHPQWRRSQVKRVFADAGYLKHWAGDLDLGPDGARIADSPVTNVSWFAARACLEAEGKRLPTTDEWEYVGRADGERADATADPAFTARLLEWYGRPNRGVIPPIQAGAIDVYGVRGMHGLVWEWVRDFNNAMITGESRGDSGLDRKLYCAGGAVDATDRTNYAAFMRYAFRSSLQGNYTVANLGFRGARDADEDS